MNNIHSPTNSQTTSREIVRPLVSVLCCSYNHEKFIGDALENIVKQETNFPFEVIVSDDASTDGTQDIIKTYASKYQKIIKAILRDKNVGVGQNYYEALTKVNSKYLAICDGDDYWIDKNKLQKQISFMESNPDYSICCSDVRWHYINVNKNDTIFKVRSYMPQEMRNKEYFSFEDLLNCRFIASASCVLRWEMQGNVPIWLKNHCVIDFPLTLIHSSYGKIKVFDETLAQYNIHENGVSRQEQTQSYKNKMNDILNYVDGYTQYRHTKEINNFINKQKTFNKMKFWQKFLRKQTNKQTNNRYSPSGFT